MKPSIRKVDLSSEYFFNEGCFITELSNSAEDSQLSIARARVKTGVTTKWHYLLGVTERYIILQGTGKVEVGELEPQLVNTGDVVLIPPEVRQRISNVGEDDLIFLALCTPRFEESIYVSM